MIEKVPRLLAIILALTLTLGLASSTLTTFGLSAALMSVGIVIVALLLKNHIERLSLRRLVIIIGAGLLLMLVVQITILSAMPVTVRHDPLRILVQADQLASGHGGWQTTYFWRYANNVPITYLLTGWIRLMRVVGLGTNGSLALLNVLCLDSFIVLLLTTVWQLSQRKTLLLGTFAFLVASPFAYTYYLQIFYSDLPTMLILLLLMRQFARWPKLSVNQRWRSGGILLSATLLGMLLKPNLIVLLPALGILLFIVAHAHLGKKSHLGLPIMLVVLGFGLSFPANKGIQWASHYQPRNGYALPATHWMVMGLNTQTNGKYNDADIDRVIALPNSRAVLHENLKQIPQRIGQLGPGGLAQLWWRKTQTLFDVSAIQDWYNGGFRSAPAWYLKHDRVLRGLTALWYQLSFTLLTLFVTIRMWTWRPQIDRAADRNALLTVLTTLGYLAFHIIFWEVESRYGQAIVPLLFLTLASTPALERLQLPKRTSRAAGALAGCATVVGAVLAVSTTLTAVGPTVVAAQRSQNATERPERVTMLAAHSTLKQTIDLNMTVNFFSVQIRSGQPTMRVTLSNSQTGNKYSLSGNGGVYNTRATLPSARYVLTVENLSSTAQPIDIVQTANYALSPYPLELNGTVTPHSSFIYEAVFNPTVKKMGITDEK